ncbi:MAG: hypothetical protein HUU20_26465 [Pirellulales bacterium]|nr:hypothetical protein [Pirellulales bacterium]
MKRFTIQNENEMDALQGAEKRRTGAAAAFVEAQQAAGRVTFSMADLMRTTGLSMIAARGQLRRLGTAVVRVSPSQQFFLIVSPENRARGGPPAEWWLDDYFRWLGQPYYLALLSAASAHGSNPQALQVTQVMTGSPRRPLEIGQVRVVFFVKRRIEETPTQALANSYAPLRVGTPAATVFDLMRYADRIGGIGRAVETLRPLLPRIGQNELRAVLKAEDEAATAQRLGYVVEKSGQSRLAAVIDDWLPVRRREIPLATTANRRSIAPLANRWRVRDNSGEFER